MSLQNFYLEITKKHKIYSWTEASNALLVSERKAYRFEETVTFCLNGQVTQLPSLEPCAIWSMYSNVNSSFHISYFRPD
jgi:hypothetical protein